MNQTMLGLADHAIRLGVDLIAMGSHVTYFRLERLRERKVGTVLTAVHLFCTY